MATRCQFENSNDVGVFANLTNAYCIVALGGAENFYSVFESELADHVPVIKTSVSGLHHCWIFDVWSELHLKSKVR
jgi:translation initiation factor 6